MGNWHHLSARRLSVQTSLRWNDGLAESQKDFGFSVQKTLVFWDGHKAEYTAGESDWKGYEKGMRELLQDSEKVRRFTPEARAWLEVQSRKIRTLASKDCSKDSDEEFLKKYNEISALVGEFYTRMWLVFLMYQSLCDAIKRMLSKKVSKDAGAIIRTLSTPRVQNDAMRQRQELLKISLEKDPRRLEEKLANHTRAFEHIPMYDFDHMPYGVDHFRKELKSVRNSVAELKETKKAMAERETLFHETVRNLGFAPDSLGANLVRMASNISHLRDYRDTLRQKNNLALAGFFGQLAKRAKLSVRQISLLSDEEIRGFLKGKTAIGPLKKIAHARDLAYLILKTGTGTKIWAGQEALKKANQELQTQESGAIQGTTGNPGIAQGPARIVHTNQDLHKIKEGDILVVHMTRQDFVPFMRRCAAIVADEGGVICHAAIVARELGLPCIVGAKTATRVLKDGQPVWVDAGKGTVKRV